MIAIRTCFVALLALFALNKVYPQTVSLYKQVSPKEINITASSTLNGFSASDISNGSGMTFNFHQSQNLGNTMWISEPSKSVVRANDKTKKGVVWLMCEFARAPKKIDQIKIWNHNQNQHTGRGLNRVYIEYSVDGKNWQLLKNDGADYFTIPQAVGRKQEPASIAIDLKGIALKYICITADAQSGNHYHDGTDETIALAKEMHQNVNYYGLSEICFYQKERVAATQLSKINDFLLKPSQGYIKTDQGAAREFDLIFPSPLFCGGRLKIDVAGKQKVIEIKATPDGVMGITNTFPAGYMDEQVKAKIEFTTVQGGKSAPLTQVLDIPAARKWTLYFLPHSHLDIGYTHRQKDVMDLQIRNLNYAIDLAERTANYPKGSQFKWNAEATWTVDGYLAKYKGSEREKKFIDAVQKGYMGLDATLGSILTGVSKQEELMHIFDDAHKISEITGTEINTAMMSDVPGQSWGIVTAMAQNGVKYFSSGPNYVPMLGRMGSHGVGLYNLKWGDVPFWWQSQSGNDRVLYWQTGKGYSMFHGWLMDKLSVCGTEPIWQYLSELEQQDYPYALTYLRYTIHGDNGPPDQTMSDVIRQWNEKYESPQFVIGTTKELFTEMEHLYADRLPVYSGDMTPIWEDGAASSARELAMNRASAERLNQSEILWSMTQPTGKFPSEELLDAWKYVVLFSEHTWGASASGPEPESKFTKDLWAGKKMYADSADIISRQVAGKVVNLLTSATENPKFIRVYNTNLWSRSDVALTPPHVSEVDLNGKILRSPEGVLVPVQKCASGWMFYAADVPALSSSVYCIENDERSVKERSLLANDNVLDNGRIRVEIDKNNGTIASLVRNGEKYEYAAEGGLNGYIYSGRGGDNPVSNGKVLSITLIESGDVSATIRVESEAAGCKVLYRDITIYRDIDRIDIVNTVDKLNVYEYENVRFEFPFNFLNPEIAMDLAMSEIHPEREQLISSNKNFYSIHNGISVSDINRGVYLSTIDAPFVELGSMTADISRQRKEGTGWLNSATISPTIYSWVMNNRWRTNYKASQDGVTVFRYSIQLFNPESANLKKYGIDQTQKLIAVESSDDTQSKPLFRIKGKSKIAVSTIRPSKDGDGYIVRLQNTSSMSVNGVIEWGSLDVEKVYYCDNSEIVSKELDPSALWMKPYECATIKIVNKK